MLALMDTGADGVVALVRDAGATFLAPIYHELTGDHLHERHAAQPHRDREPRVPGAVRDGLHLRRRRARRRAPRSSSTAPATRRWSVADAETPVDTANRLIAYHAPISRALTQERTSLESALIPVTAYIVVACAESYLRYPEMMRAHRRGDAGRGDRSASPAPGLPGRPLLPVVDRQLLPARPQDHGDGRPAGRRPGAHGDGPRLLGARRARLPRRRHPPGVGHRHLADLRRRHRRRPARRARCRSPTTSTGPR